MVDDGIVAWVDLNTSTFVWREDCPHGPSFDDGDWRPLCYARAGTERIVRAACKVGEAVYSVPVPGRHGDVLALPGCPFIQPDEQGFLTSTGRFVDRSEARGIAERRGQLLPDARQMKELFSEDVW